MMLAICLLHRQLLCRVTSNCRLRSQYCLCKAGAAITPRPTAAVSFSRQAACLSQEAMRQSQSLLPGTRYLPWPKPGEVLQNVRLLQTWT